MKPGKIQTSITCEVLPNLRAEMASQPAQVQKEATLFADQVDRDGDGYASAIEKDYYYLQFAADISLATTRFIDGLYGQSRCTDDKGKKIELISVKKT